MSIKATSLLSEDRYRYLKLNKEALKEIETLKGDLIILIFIGEPKSGKSFLASQIHSQLNNLSHKNYAFKIDDIDDDDKSGLNFVVNKISLNSEQVNLLIIESESSNLKLSKNLFLFSVLTGSIIFYNTFDILFNNDYKKLEFLLNLSSTIKLKSSLSWQVTKNNELKDEGCILISIVRDQSLKIVEQEELEKLLKIDFNFKEDHFGEIGLKNKIKANLFNYFSGIKSLHLPIPFKKMNLDLVLFYEDFNQDFRSGLKYLCNQIKYVKPKSINNIKLNGITFSLYLVQLVELINKDRIIYIHDIITKACLDELKYYEQKFLEVVNAFKNVPHTNSIHRRNHFENGFLQLKIKVPKHKIDLFYLKFMFSFYTDEFFNYSKEFPVKTQDLINKHEELFNYCWNKFNFYTPNYSLISIDENLKIFQNETNNVFNNLTNLNESKINDYNLNEAVKLWNLVFKPKLMGYTSVNQLALDLMNFKTKFKRFQFDSKTILTNTFWNYFEMLINLKGIEQNITYKAHQI